MKTKLLILSSFIIILFLNNVARATPKVWSDAVNQTSENEYRGSGLKDAGDNALVSRPIILDELMLNRQLGISQDLSSKPISILESSPVIVNIPLPQGGEIQVKAEVVSVLAPDLASQFPEIKTWRVIGVHDEHIHGRIDQTMHGFHAMLLMPDGDTIFVEPDNKLNTTGLSNRYISFSKAENKSSINTTFQCRTHADNGNGVTQQSSLSRRLLGVVARPASSLITYRLAIAATGEYTQYNGGTKKGALSAIVTTINRVNEIYERDFGIKLQLISDEMSIIYTDPRIDPYTGDDIDALLDENLLNLSRGRALSKDKYDIAHVFSAVNIGGLAYTGGVCGNFKAGGVSGIRHPVNDVFNIGYVAHEIGHQLGATHTFNSSCGLKRRGGTVERVGITAVEPGSGSTIMAYAGICSSDDLQSKPDSQFHAVTISQVYDYTRANAGSNCGIRRTVSNQNPEVNAGPDRVVPAQTPFMLVASGQDADRDVLSYTWEQSDIGKASSVDVDTGDNAVIRSRPENTSRIRYIPRLDDLFAGKTVVGERLLSRDRDMHFVVTIRDGKGGVQANEMKMKVVGMGRPLSVTSHRFEEALIAKDETTVTWDVAGTSGTPINCKNVDISLIKTNGDNYFLGRTTNNGSKSFAIPEDVPYMDRARLMVSCSDNLFFNISTADLVIGKKQDSKSEKGGSFDYLILMLLILGMSKRIRRGAFSYEKDNY